ncbi:MAG: hypothetical protein H6854_00555 [Rhodospirillales bacterium]|nr:hypothetical protein [Rhodospirillales bacterium]
MAALTAHSTITLRQAFEDVQADGGGSQAPTLKYLLPESLYADLQQAGETCLSPELLTNLAGKLKTEDPGSLAEYFSPVVVRQLVDYLPAEVGVALNDVLASKQERLNNGSAYAGLLSHAFRDPIAKQKSALALLSQSDRSVDNRQMAVQLGVTREVAADIIYNSARILAEETISDSLKRSFSLLQSDVLPKLDEAIDIVSSQLGMSRDDLEQEVQAYMNRRECGLDHLRNLPDDFMLSR